MRLNALVVNDNPMETLLYCFGGDGDSGGGGGGSAGDFDDSYNEAMGYDSGFDDGDTGDTGGDSSYDFYADPESSPEYPQAPDYGSLSSGNDNNSFFTGTFDDPGEPGFSGPSYEGQYGTDSDGTVYGSGDVGEDFEIDKISAQFDKLNAIQDTGFNFNRNYAVMDATGDIRGFDPRGGRYGADDAAFFSRTIGEYGIAGDIYSTVDRSTGFANTVRRGFEGLANGIAERFGTSLTRDYTVIPGAGYVGEVFEDYSATDAIGNLIGMVVPGGARVDRYMSRELTSTGKGAMAFGEGKAFYGAIDTQYAMTPEEEEAMFAAQRAADEAERARGGSDPASQVASTVTGTVTRPRSAILGALIGDTASPSYNIVAPYTSDAFSYFTSGFKNYFGFAEGGEVPGAQTGGQAEAITGPLGFVGGPPEQMSEAQTVADDVPVEVQEGAYVLNAAAVEYMGSADVKNMILSALQELKAQGVDKAQSIDKIELDTQVSLLVSKGEVLIPPQVAQVIGYDRLEKINKRGLRETEKRVQENGQSPEAEALDQQPANPAEGMAMASGGIPSKAELDRQISEDPLNFYEMNVAGEMGPALAEAREIRDGVNGMFNVHRLYEKMLRDIEEYKAPEVMSRTNVEMGQTQSQRDTTLMESDGRLPLIEDDMTPQNAANMYQNFPSFRRYIMDRIEAGQSEQVQGVLDNYEKFLESHAGDNLPEQNPVYTEEDFAKARELEQMEFVRDFIDSRVVSKTPVGGFLSKSY